MPCCRRTGNGKRVRFWPKADVQQQGRQSIDALLESAGWVVQDDQAATGVADLLALDESQTLEFKPSARWNVRAATHDKKMEHVIVKTVCGFRNAEGGKLSIDVDDSGQVLGLREDYATLGKKQDRDGYELFLRQ